MRCTNAKVQEAYTVTSVMRFSNKYAINNLTERIIFIRVYKVL